MLFKALWRAYPSIKYNDKKFIESNHHYFLYWWQVEGECNSQQAYIMLPYHDWQYRYALLVICNVSQLRWYHRPCFFKWTRWSITYRCSSTLTAETGTTWWHFINRHSSWTIISLILLPFFPFLFHIFSNRFFFSLLFLSTLPKTAELAEESKLKSVKFNGQIRQQLESVKMHWYYSQATEHVVDTPYL